MTLACDVVVIGGGIIGCAVAYYASRRGLSVTLVDQPKRGRATSASAGGLWPIGESVGLGCGVIFHRATASHAGPPPLPRCFFDFAMRSNAMFPDLVGELREDCGIDVEWDRTGLLFVMYDEADEAFGKLVRERCPGGPRLTTWLSPEELAKAEPNVARGGRGAILFHGDDQVNPYRLADAFRAAARARGALVLTHTEVTAVRVESGRVVAVETAEGPIPCRYVVNAAGAWAGRIAGMVGIDLPVRPVRGQIVGTEPQPPGTLNACLSTSDCYLMQKRHGEIIIGSTTEEVGFDPGVTDSAMKTLAAGAIRAVPMLEEVRAKRTWSGFRPGTPDELPILGPVAGLDGYVNACGHFRTGIVNSPLTGLILAELLAGDPPSFPIEPFLLSRFDRRPLNVP